MMLTRTSVPAGLAVPLAEAKLALRVDGTDFDSRLEALIRSQTARYEAFTGRVLLPTSMRLSLEGWRSDVRLPATPVRDVVAVGYRDGQEADRVFAASYWRAYAGTPFWHVALVPGVATPEVSFERWPVWIEFEVGHDDPAAGGSGGDPMTASAADDREAIILMVGSIHDGGRALPEVEMRQIFGHRRVMG